MHVAEETKNPRKDVPWAMVGCLLVNGSMGFAMLIAVLYGMGDLDTAINTPIGFPIVEMFLHISRGSKAAATAMTCTIVISAWFAAVGMLASSSRALYAFARDGGTPFAWWLSRLHPQRRVPTNAVICVCSLLTLLALLNIASTTAFNAILSLAVVGLYLSYLISVSIILFRRFWNPQTLQYGPWRLPKSVGMTVNVFSMIYLAYTGIFLLFPPLQPVTADNMNYACLVLGAALLFSTFNWFLWGRKHFKGPSDLATSD